MKTEGLFRKVTREGVSDVLGRWIRNERPGMDPGGERRRWPAGTVTPMANSIAGGMEVTGARGQRPTGHGSEIRRHWEKAGEEGNSARAKKWLEDAGSAVAAMAGGQGLRSTRPGLKKPRK